MTELPELQNLTNVVEFPKVYNGPPRNKEEAEEILNHLAEDYAENVVEFLGTILFNQLQVAGIRVSQESYTQDLILVHEALKSVILKEYGISHPLQQLAEVIFNKHNRIVVFQVGEDGTETQTKIDTSL